MNTLLFLFALPLATIILSVVLLKILKCPALVAATFFSIYLILTYTAFDPNFLILAVIYTILSYLTAIIARTICRIISRINNCSKARIINENYCLSNNAVENSNYGLCNNTKNIPQNYCCYRRR